MTEKELISKLQELKQIKPRKEWVSLARMNMFSVETTERKVIAKPVFHWNSSNVFNVFSQRKIAYSLATLLFMFVGLAGFLTYGFPQDVKVTKQSVVTVSPAEMLAEDTIKSTVADFKVKSHDLAKIMQNKSEDATVALNAVKEAAKSITQTIQKDPRLAKTVALDINNNKTYLDISGSDDLKDTLNDLYEPIIIQLVEDFKQMTLTESQEKSVDRIKNLVGQKKFMNALEDALLLGMAIKGD